MQGIYGRWERSAIPRRTGGQKSGWATGTLEEEDAVKRTALVSKRKDNTQNDQ